MKRREFLRLLGWGLAATWSGGRLFWARPALAGPDHEIHLALLADAHLVDGGEGRPEAASLALAVAEIRALKPAPDLVLFAGDLAHQADPKALALGQEILSDLPAPLFLVMGEGDGLPDGGAAWRRLFGDPWFSHNLPGHPCPGYPTAPIQRADIYQPLGSFAHHEKSPPSPQPTPWRGERESLRNFPRRHPDANLLPPTANRKPPTRLQMLGLHAAWCAGPAGPGFNVGESGRRWLARELEGLDPGQPLLLLSHAPLARLFRPWQQWTGDAPEVINLLSQFTRVLCCHGHVHRSGVSEGINQDLGFPTANRKPETGNRIFHQGLPATAWPRPDALQGTPAALRPGLGPLGCGWAQVCLGPGSLKFQPRLWQA